MEAEGIEQESTSKDDQSVAAIAEVRLKFNIITLNRLSKGIYKLLATNNICM